MVTISTNADPGQGSDGDAIYVDDLSFIYNINGQRVSTMRHGQVYILKQGQQTSKKLY